DTSGCSWSEWNPVPSVLVWLGHGYCCWLDRNRFQQRMAEPQPSDNLRSWNRADRGRSGPASHLRRLHVQSHRDLLRRSDRIHHPRNTTVQGQEADREGGDQHRLEGKGHSGRSLPRSLFRNLLRLRKLADRIRVHRPGNTSFSLGLRTEARNLKLTFSCLRTLRGFAGHDRVIRKLSLFKAEHA